MSDIFTPIPLPNAEMKRRLLELWDRIGEIVLWPLAWLMFWLFRGGKTR